MSKSYSCWGCDFHDAVGDYCFREEKDHHFIRACDIHRTASEFALKERQRNEWI
jgi:hypothetical protein